MKGEKSHMQGRIFLKNFFLCLLLTNQGKRKLKEKTHIVPEKRNKTKKQAHNFLEQNKLLETLRRKRNPIFNVHLQVHILLSLLGYKEINIFLNKTSRKKK